MATKKKKGSPKKAKAKEASPAKAKAKNASPAKAKVEKGSVAKRSTKPASRPRTVLASDEKPKAVSPSGKTDSNFFEQVYGVARMIPKGRVTSYGAIAASLGTKSSSRMVGWAMNSCRSARPKVPAHRVVNRMGILSGKHHFEDPSEMERMLAKEGVEVKGDQVVDFKNLFWDPAVELGI